MITKTERNELRSVVRQQFKVLRAEVNQREAEHRVELNDAIREKYAQQDRTYADLQDAAQEVIREANRRLNDLLYDAEIQTRSGSERVLVEGSLPRLDTSARADDQRNGLARITAQVKNAMAQLDRQEADLLRELAVGAVESEEARGFLSSIPTVAQLVPSGRMLALISSPEPAG